ncbi:DUF3788 family protein [Tunturiibacter gelidiferens]|uniref:DUF3788 family protein n=1 Tax=Tunturiibacter gelidiferens TaxID=3069689 RepID=UPI003D9BE959
MHNPPRIQAAFDRRSRGGAEREKFEERRYVWRSQLVKLYDEAKIYPDGRFLTVAISSAEDRREVMELLIMKRPPPSRGAGKSHFGAISKIPNCKRPI